MLMVLVILGLFIFFCSSHALTCYSCNTDNNTKCKYPLEVDSIETCTNDRADAYCYKTRVEYSTPGDADIFFYFYIHF